LLARTGDVEAALTGFGQRVEAFQAAMGDTYARNGLRYLVAWLARLGYHDGAARLYGAVTRGHPDTWMTAMPEVAGLADVMGDAAFTAAFGEGAALDPRATGELAHQLLAQIRADRLGA
jgi:hypothetical protein